MVSRKLVDARRKYEILSVPGCIPYRSHKGSFCSRTMQPSRPNERDHEPNLVDWTTKVCWIMTRRVIFTPSPAASNDPPNAAGNGHSLEFTTV